MPCLAIRPGAAGAMQAGLHFIIFAMLPPSWFKVHDTF
jgi:hypothetical protein